MVHWTEAQLFDLFLPWAEQNDETWYGLWLAYAMTGARAHELLGVRWGDVDFEKRKLTLRVAKGDRPPDHRPGRRAGRVPHHGEGRAGDIRPLLR